MLSPLQRRTWAVVDLDEAQYNYECVHQRLKNNTKICCVVKANGYGHGAVQLSRLYENLGADYLTVSNIEEAIQLRKANISLPVLILGYTDPHCANDLYTYRISQCIYSYEYGELLSQNAKETNAVVKIHLKIDTGMGRIGFQCEDSSLDKAVQVCNMAGLEVEGIFTHFASADEGEEGREYTYKQYDRFMRAIDYIEAKGISFSIRHCANSAGIFDFPEMHLDMVRAGVVLYGLQPSKSLKNPGGLKPIMSLHTVIEQIKTVQTGEFVGYGCEYRANKEMKVATIPIGYADGLWRSNYPKHMMVEVEGHYATIVGRICMDQCMIDITDIPEVSIGSLITVYGKANRVSVDYIADINDTINYEITCALGERVPRVYKQNGEEVALMDSLI